MAFPPNDPSAPILNYGMLDEASGFVRVTPDQLLAALAERLWPAIADGDANIYDCATLIDGWPVMLVDATDPAWDAYRPAPEPEPEGGE